MIWQNLKVAWPHMSCTGVSVYVFRNRLRVQRRGSYAKARWVYWIIWNYMKTLENYMSAFDILKFSRSCNYTSNDNSQTIISYMELQVYYKLEHGPPHYKKISWSKRNIWIKLLDHYIKAKWGRHKKFLKINLLYIFFSIRSKNYGIWKYLYRYP